MNPSRIYRKLAELPVFNSASFISSSVNGCHVTIESNVREHVNNVQRAFTQDLHSDSLSSASGLSPGSSTRFWMSNPIERSESIVAKLISPSGKRTALLKETKSTPKKRFVEIWNGDLAELRLETTNRHGSFYGDATFSSLCFSRNENALLYTAEDNPPEEDPKDPFKKFRFTQSFGETFVSKKNPTLFWLRWTTSDTSFSKADEANGEIKEDNDDVMSELIKLKPSPSLVFPQAEDKGASTGFHLGQAIFASFAGTSVIATAYFPAPGDRKLGIVYCTNRPSMIVYFKLPQASTSSVLPSASSQSTIKTIPQSEASLSASLYDATAKGVEEKDEKGKDKSEAEITCFPLFWSDPCRSPRIWYPPNDPSYFATSMAPILVWLSSAKEPHGSCSKLHMLRLPKDGDLDTSFLSGIEPNTAKTSTDTPSRSLQVGMETVVDSVWEPSKSVDEGGFPGLYVNQLPSSPFLLLDHDLHVVCVSNWGCSQTLMAIPLTDGENTRTIHQLSLPESRSCTGVSCDGRSSLVAFGSSLSSPNEIFIGEVNGIQIQSGVRWTKASNIRERVSSLLDTIESKVVNIEGHEPAQTILLKLKDSKIRPLITIAHGGPHAVTSRTFSPENIAYVLAGYNISFPNYRGSLGYGQKWVEELLGRIGELEVGDVMASAKQLIRMGYGKDPEEESGMQLYMGGSHGGFIGAHVIGQFPKFFSAAVLRNPVINIGSMIGTTDIPDWAPVECGLPYKSAAVLTPELYSELYAKSPVQYVDKVTTPLLLKVGEIDQRVPPSQAKEYYHLLKAREERGDGDVKVEMLLFPENGHPLDGVEAEKIGWDATFAWFKKHAPPK